ncbi:mechanosensitive ion channel family protein [Lentimicrobium sp.]|jgi:small-conductance mechanosensitive channel|uniref:mechanosensitive ion channel family protein n=3 Tax=Lentimicrobium sp. TaxID=2034841 RepID=UPI002BEE4B61|nr:mechanosensitive ion channel family protein [Lentimicrobium sp.]HPF65136.1 mechanosensitive ion channel family protein [Lentimicrobium sp.]HPR26365.1 mechanosensitive ion channel family protein [Lentimicrobium sp.]
MQVMLINIDALSASDYQLIRYFIIALIIGLIAVILSRILQKLMRVYFERSSRVLKVDPTRYKFLRNAVSFVIFMLAVTLIFYTIPGLRTIGITLFAGAGIFAAIIGFASQEAFSNIVSGIFIVIFKPFRVGDNIKIGDLHQGTVEDITLRHTIINNFENRRIIIPNTVISGQTIINSTIEDEKVCTFIELGISYDADLEKAIEILRDEAEKHPYCIDNRNQEDKEKGIPKVVVRVLGFGDSAVNLRAYAWSANSGEGFEMKCDIFESLKKRFNAQGIEIPYPHRTLVFKNQPPHSIP